MVLQTDACISLDRMHILMYFQTQYQQIEIRKLSKTKQADALMETAVSITENQEISLIVEVEDSPVLLDLPDFKETIKIGPYSRSAFSLYAYHSKQQFPWTPGLLIYSVMIANENYYGLIRIEPKNISDSEFSIMHQYLEEKLQGITRNYTSERKQWYESPVQDLRKTDTQMVDWFLSRSKQLINALQLIERNHISTYKNIYVMENTPKHTDIRSIRLRNSPKGAKFGGTKFFNRKKIPSFDSPENGYVKYCSLELLREMKQEVQKLKTIICEKIVPFEQQQLKRSYPLPYQSFQRGIEQNEQNNISFERKIQSRELLEKVRQTEFALNYLSQLMHNPFWVQIKAAALKRSGTIADRNYVLFNRYLRQFHELQKINRQKQAEKNEDHILHPTSKLYEYYTFFKLIDIFELLDFRITDLESVSNDAIHPFSNVVFIRDNLKIVVTYDEEVKYGAQEAIQTGNYFFSRSSKRRPDIRVDLYQYDQTSDAHLYQSSVILEIKYRPLNNFYSETSFTPEMEQLNQYHMIKYYCPVRKEYFNEVKDVICVHPNIQDNDLFHTEVGIFVTLRPSVEERFTSCMKERLQCWLQRSAQFQPVLQEI